MAKPKLDKLTKQEREILEQAQAICDVIKTPGWSAIASFIASSIQWPDPKKYLGREEVILPYTEAYGAGELARKIGEFVNSQESIIKSLTAKLDTDEEAPNFKIGE